MSAASDWSRCSSRDASRWIRVDSVAARAMPRETEALPSWNQGSTVWSMTPNPSPSGLSRSEAATGTPSRRIGALALPRRPRPSQAPSQLRPGASRGTK